MVMLSIQGKVAYERTVQIKGWNITRKRDAEVRDPIHDTVISITPDETTIKGIISTITEDHTFIEQGLLSSGDAIGSFLLTDTLQQGDEIVDSITGKTYSIVKIWKAGMEAGKIQQNRY